MREFFDNAALQSHPLRVLKEFLEEEKHNEAAKKYDELRFIGYVLDINYDTVTIITSDPYKVAVGGIPRNSLLIMTPDTRDNSYPTFYTSAGSRRRPYTFEQRNPTNLFRAAEEVHA
jgi:hypothetical protein